jgi:periplasmic copper chaperone A
MDEATLEGEVMKLMQIFLVLSSAVVLVACTSGGGTDASIEVQNAWARAATATEMGGHGAMETPSAGGMEGMGANSAAYMLLRNNGDKPDKLLRAESDVAEAVELHVSEMQGEVMTMRPIEYVEVPANSDVELKPGGMHVMLIGIKRDLKPGDTINLVLVFENAGRISVQAEVRAP